ncbi:MAG: FAD-dependent thymidylate synthase [Oscillospiraceae bacterium]|nr:FAD-dependent thymidylate synthase [Oscillospiraceae bacterium]
MAKVTLLCHTPEPEKIIAAAAKLCYSNQTVEGLMDGLTPEKTESFLNMLVSMGHESPIEHASFTFAIEGVSRSLLAQITRHRLASYSVQSQRYVRLSPFEYVTPDAVKDDPEALAAYEEAMKAATESYEKIADILKAKYVAEYVADGLDEKTARNRAEKKAIEDARFVFPNACETRMVVTMNARSLYNFFAHRCCSRAQWEIREVADQMLALVKEVAPVLFKTAGPPCVKGPCPEGKMSCGRMVEMRERYLNMGEK